MASWNEVPVEDKVLGDQTLLRRATPEGLGVGLRWKEPARAVCPELCGNRFEETLLRSLWCHTSFSPMTSWWKLLWSPCPTSFSSWAHSSAVCFQPLLPLGGGVWQSPSHSTWAEALYPTFSPVPETSAGNPPRLLLPAPQNEGL